MRDGSIAVTTTFCSEITVTESTLRFMMFIACICVFILYWSAFQHLTAWASGWKLLAMRYRSTLRASSKTVGYCFIKILRVEDGTPMPVVSRTEAKLMGIRFSVFDDALQITSPGMLSPGYSPLLVPWNEIIPTGKRGRFEFAGDCVTLGFVKEPTIQIITSGAAADMLMTFGAPWRIAENGQIESSRSAP